jgi:hypothetical protein
MRCPRTVSLLLYRRLMFSADAIKVQVAQNDWLNRLVAWARSPNKDVRLQVRPAGTAEHSSDCSFPPQVASALQNLIQNDVIAMRVMEEFGAALFVSMADINDVHVQHVVEQCIQRLQRFTTRTSLPLPTFLPTNQMAMQSTLA